MTYLFLPVTLHTILNWSTATYQTVQSVTCFCNFIYKTDIILHLWSGQRTPMASQMLGCRRTEPTVETDLTETAKWWSSLCKCTNTHTSFCMCLYMHTSWWTTDTIIGKFSKSGMFLARKILLYFLRLSLFTNLCQSRCEIWTLRRGEEHEGWIQILPSLFLVGFKFGVLSKPQAFHRPYSSPR